MFALIRFKEQSSPFGDRMQALPRNRSRRALSAASELFQALIAPGVQIRREISKIA
jgi:hypothetical protein